MAIAGKLQGFLRIGAMPVRSGACVGLLLVAIGFPALLNAQFQAPTDEELKMTAELKAPGADAIYLYREETVDDTLHYHTTYTRIKILTEKAKELATITIPYPKGEFSISEVKARTIHADGKVIPLDVKPSDLVETKGKGYQINKMVFTLPSAEVGSIFEYRWQLEYKDGRVVSPEWEVQQRYYVRKAHYSFLPSKHFVTNGRGEAANNLVYSAVLPTNVKVIYETSGKYTLDVTDIPARPEEEYMPPLQSWMFRVTFYYTPYLNKEEYWKSEGSRWSKEVDRFAGQTPKLRDAVATVVSPTDGEDAKARKIYDAVMALDNTNYSRRKSQTEMKDQHLKPARDAEEVWLQKSGNGNEMALLYLAMARSAGLKAYAMTVCNRDRAIFNPFFLQMSQFHDLLVVVMVDGKQVMLDPGRRFAAFGQLDWRHTMAGAMHQTDQGPALGVTPANSYKDAATLRTADLTVARDGSVTGLVRINMNGPAAMRWRERAIESDEDEIKKEFDESMHRMLPPGVNASFDHFVGLEDYHSQLMGIVKISGNLGTVTGRRVFLPGDFFESHARHPFVEDEKRQTAVDMQYADVVRDEIVFHIPASMTVESAPPDTAVPWAGHATLHLKSEAKADQVSVNRTFIRAFAVLEPKDYTGLRDFYQKVAAADQQQVVLTSISGTKASGQ